MAVRKFKPTTPGQRHKIIGTFEEITASVPEKSLVFGKRSTGGRNNVGKMTMPLSRPACAGCGAWRRIRSEIDAACASF